MFNGINPDELEHMAELARGRYFSAPTFNGVKQKFTALFNFGKTVWYSAPTIQVEVKDGVVLSEVMEVNGLDRATGNRSQQATIPSPSPISLKACSRRFPSRLKPPM